MNSAATEAAILAAAGRVTDPLRPLSFAFCKRHGVLIARWQTSVADVVCRAGAQPPRIAEVRACICGARCSCGASTAERSIMLREAYEGGSNTAMQMGGMEDDTDLAHLAQDLPEPSDLLESDDRRRSSS